MIIYVVPEGEQWIVKREHEDEPVSIYDSKKEAFEAAKEISIGQEDAELVVLRPDGTIDNLGAYSVDPFPSKDNALEYNEEPEEENT